MAGKNSYNTRVEQATGSKSNIYVGDLSDPYNNPLSSNITEPAIEDQDNLADVPSLGATNDIDGVNIIESGSHSGGYNHPALLFYDKACFVDNKNPDRYHKKGVALQIHERYRLAIDQFHLALSRPKI